MTIFKSQIAILLLQGVGLVLMGAYFSWDFYHQFHEIGAGPFVSAVGLVEMAFATWAHQNL